MVVIFQKNFFTGEEDTTINRILGLSSIQVWIFPHLGWGRVDHLLGVHHTLVWYRVFQNNWRPWLQILLWGLLRGRWCRRALSVHGFPHLLESNNLGEMMSIMSILTTYNARKVSPYIFVLPLSWLIVIGAPLGVLVLVSPNGMVVGVVPS
jgi:hypothetical protein